MATTNLNLDKVTTAQTVNTWVNYFNGNMDKLDAFPIPIAGGSNSQLSYLKFSNGMLMMWGHIESGTSYPCNQPWENDTYASSPIRITFPVPTDGTVPAAFVAGVDTHRTEITALRYNVTSEGMSIVYWSPSNLSNQGSKYCDIFVIGKWA